MNNNLKSALLFALGASLLSTGYAQDTVHYSGTTLSRVDYHYGQLPAAVGVHNIQVMRANREQPATADGLLAQLKEECQVKGGATGRIGFVS